MPMIVFIAIILTFAFYLMYIFPKTTGLLTKYNIKVPPMMHTSMVVSDFLVANALWLGLGVVIPSAIALYYFRTPKGGQIPQVHDQTADDRFTVAQIEHRNFFPHSECSIRFRRQHQRDQNCGRSVPQQLYRKAGQGHRAADHVAGGQILTDCLSRTGVFPPNA
jgi:hypothetical protein